MNYLLTGAEFNNKGAEAMTLIALKNIYENDPDANVYLLDIGFYPSFELKKTITYIALPTWYLRILLGRKPVLCYRSRIKDFFYYFIPGKKSFFGTLKKTKEILKQIDIMIDISGFAFSSKWGDSCSINWLSRIELLQKNGADVWIMPQSFGPFDFSSPKLLEYAKPILEKCKYIYAREEKGYELLKNQFELTNITRSPDSVLMEKNFNPALVVKDYEKIIEKIDIFEEHNIAIVPNYRLIDVGKIDYEKIINFYCDCIHLVKKKFHIYLIAHAGEDLIVCKKIKEKFVNSDKVTIIDHVMTSFNYESFIKKMNFIIASRYHSIIHAYKEGVPAVVLGWADKYKGIVSEVEQIEYLIDLDSYQKALKVIENMANLYENESKKIQKKLEKIQEFSCYTFLKELNA